MNLQVIIGKLSSLSLQSKLLQKLKKGQEIDPYLSKVSKEVEEGKRNIFLSIQLHKIQWKNLHPSK